eukprot:13422755-Heterocapsa_arctica.AAC.1
MCDLGHIKSRETGWADGQGLQIGTLIRSSRQEDLARKILRKAISARGKPQEDSDSWEENQGLLRLGIAKAHRHGRTICGDRGSKEQRHHARKM